MNRDSWLTPFDSKLDSDFFKSSNINSRTESRIESKFESRIESMLDDHRQRLRLPWTNHNSIFDDRMFDFGNQIAAMQREIEETFRRFQNHEFSSSSSLKPLSLTNFSNVHNVHNSNFNSLSLTPYIEAHTDVDGRETGKYTMNIPIGGIISPEDLRISLKDHVMTIEAKKERQEGNSKTYQEFHRKFTLPPSVDPRDVKSVLTPEGTLKIEAPLPRRAIEAPRTSSQLIPIHREY